MTVTIYNSKDKEQKKITKSTRELLISVLQRIKGKAGWWARLDYDDGDWDIFHFYNGEWFN